MTEEYACPFCNQTDWKNEINLAYHIEKEHYYKSIKSYIRLREKIKDKITKSQKELPDSDYIQEEFTESDCIKLLLWELEDLLK